VHSRSGLWEDRLATCPGSASWNCAIGAGVSARLRGKRAAVTERCEGLIGAPALVRQRRKGAVDCLGIHKRVSYRLNWAATHFRFHRGARPRRISLHARLARGELWLTLAAPHVTLDAMNADPALLRAALVGYENRLAHINEAIVEIRNALAQTGDPAPAPPRVKRKLSRAARARIAAAQKRRLAEYKKSKGKP